MGPRSSSDADEYEWGLKHFLAEARTLAQLDHERIVRVYRVIEAWGTAFMVMEYIKGRNLGETLQAEGPWPEAQVRALLEALLPGLTYVHGAGLIHRDIKPSNVMLREDGSPVLIDFGAARYAVGQHSQSLKSVLTAGYAPFEQYENRGNQGPWTDVYALGAVAYRALSGLVPEDATMRVRTDPLVPVTQVAAGVSEAFGSAVMSALAVWPENRPQDVEAWRAQWDAGAPSEHHPPPPPPPEDDRPGPGGPTIITPPQTGFWEGGAGRRVAYGVAALVVAAAVTASIATWAGRPVPDPELVTSSSPSVTSSSPSVTSSSPSVTSSSPSVTSSSPSVTDDDSPPELRRERALGLDRAAWRRIQEGLAALGFNPGAPDGVAGDGTRRAVRQYQESEGKAITGYLDAADMERLQDVFPRLVMNTPAGGHLLGDGTGGRLVFNGIQGQGVRVEAGSDAFDTTLELVSPTGVTIAEDDDGGAGTDSLLEMVLPVSGRYEIRVTAYDNGDSGPYTVTVGDAGRASPPSRLVLNEMDIGKILGDGTGGRWAFDGTRGQEVIVQASALFDTVVELVSPTGVVIAEDDDGGDGTDSLLEMALPVSGRYEVRVTAFDGDDGVYFVMVSDATYDAARRLVMNTEYTGELLGDGTGGRWTFDGREGQEIRVEVSSDAFDTTMELVSPTGVVIAEDDDSGAGTDSSLLKQVWVRAASVRCLRSTGTASKMSAPGEWKPYARRATTRSFGR